MNIIIKQLINIDENTLSTITNWMYNWWGKTKGYLPEEVKCYMVNSLQKNRLPQTYGLFLENKIIGIYQITTNDLNIRPDIYPWIANVYIDEQYRGKGYGRKLIASIKENLKQNTNFKEVFLYTKHIGLYEKFGFKLVSEIDTYKEMPRIQRLYKLDLK